MPDKSPSPLPKEAVTIDNIGTCDKCDTKNTMYGGNSCDQKDCNGTIKPYEDPKKTESKGTNGGDKKGASK